MEYMRYLTEIQHSKAPVGSRTLDAHPYHELERLANTGFPQEIALSLPKLVASSTHSAVLDSHRAP